MKSRKILISVVVLALLVSIVAVLSASAAPSAAPPAPKAKFSTAVAFDKTPALRDMTRSAAPARLEARPRTKSRATSDPIAARLQQIAVSPVMEPFRAPVLCGPRQQVLLPRSPAPIANFRRV